MTSRSQIESAIRALYEARVRGDVEGVVSFFTQNAVYRLHGAGTGSVALGRPAEGLAMIRLIVTALVQTSRFSNWKEIALLVDGEQAALHWRALATHGVTGKSVELDLFDFYKFRDGKILELQQSFDTALAMSIAAKPV